MIILQLQAQKEEEKIEEVREAKAARQEVWYATNFDPTSLLQQSLVNKPYALVLNLHIFT